MAGVTIGGECGSSRAALAAIRTRSPDVILLDIAMPGLDGLSLARRLAGLGGPLVVFVTACEEHALEAFRIHAADYVLKPLDRRRLRDALEHARLAVRRVCRERGGADGAVEDVGGSASSTVRMAVRDGYRTQIVPIADVLWVESFGNYARVYTTVARYTHRGTMARLTDEPSRSACSASIARRSSTRRESFACSRGAMDNTRSCSTRASGSGGRTHRGALETACGEGRTPAERLVRHARRAVRPKYRWRVTM